MDKRGISQILEEIGMMLELKGENPFKVKAYYNGARIIELMEEDILQLAEEGRLHEIKGIGKALEDKISEFVETGNLAYYQELKKELPVGLMSLLQIPGLGSKKVRELYQKLDIKSIGELQDACNENRLLDLKGFGEKTQNKILESIESMKTYEGQHLISTGINIGESLVSHLRTLKEIRDISVAGSIRRRKELIKDVDIVASCHDEDREKIMDYFTQMQEVEVVIAKGNTKTSVGLKMGLNVDLRLVSLEEYPHALQHFTGSKEHNTAIRHRAKKLGLKVNEYGIFRGEEKISAENETQLYSLLKLQYIPPELRENNGEIEAADEWRIPTLIELEDVKGVFHVHSLYSDGKNRIEELVEAAIAKGFQYIGISDHSKSAIYAGGLKEDDVLRQHKEIEALRGKYPNITILKGIESDILNDGSLDYSDEILSTFDYVIGSIHSSFKMNKDTMMARLTKAISNKYLNILGHATGRLLLSRRPYEIDIERIIDMCGEFQVAIEINSNPHRLDLDWRLCRYAKDKGVKLVVEPDAHRVEGIDDIFYGIGIARKGWLEPCNVLNSCSINKVFEFFKK